MRSTNLLKLLVLMALLGSTWGEALSQSKVVVVPLSGDDLAPLANVVTVATENGDFTDPVAAVNSITDASASNPYLVVIAPGVYDIGSDQLVMQEFVSIAGSGRSVTIIRGQRDRSSGPSSAGALFVGASNTELRDLTIENLNGANSTTLGIANSGTVNQTISNVVIRVNGDLPGSVIGIQNSGGASPTISHSKISVEGGESRNCVIENNSSSPRLLDTELVVTGTDGAGFEINIGICSGGSTVVFAENVRIEMIDSTTGSAIDNGNSTRLTFLNSSIVTDVGGISNRTTNASVIVRNSIINTAGSTAVAASTGTGTNETYISDTLIDGEVSGNPVCSFVFELDGTPLDEGCAPPP